MTIGLSVRTETCQIHGERFHEVHSGDSIERKTSQRIYVVQVETDKNSNDNQTDHVWLGFCTKIGKSRSESRKTGLCKRKAEARQCSETEREFTLSIQMTKNTEKLSKTQGENWKDVWPPSCLAKEKLQIASRKCLHNRRLHPRRLQNSVWLHSGSS